MTDQQQSATLQKRTKTHVETEVQHEEIEVDLYQCSWCGDWHEEDEMVPIGVDFNMEAVSAGKGYVDAPEDSAVWCVYCTQSVFGYDRGDRDPIYQPVVGELQHWTWKEILSATLPPLAFIGFAIVAIPLAADALSSSMGMFTELGFSPLQTLLLIAPGVYFGMRLIRNEL